MDATLKEIKDYYKVLGIKRTASAEDIKTAYYKIIRKYHPDLRPDDESAKSIFIEASEAYRILGDLDNRLKYSSMLNRRIVFTDNSDPEPANKKRRY